MNYKSAFIITAVAFFSLKISAQTNLVSTNKYPWESSAAAGLTLTKGNSDTLLLTVKLQTQRKMPVNEYSLGLDGTYGKSSGIKTTESLHGFAQWNHLFSEPFYACLRGEGLHDGVADIKYRITVGPGLGYYL